MQPAVCVEGLVKRYGDLPAVRGVSFEVQPGELFGVLGPNGAGKTTTLEILGGFRRRDGGSVQVLGHDPGTTRGLRAIRRRVGVVLQQAGHYKYLSVRETLWMHSAYYDDPRPVDEVLELVELRDAAERRVKHLSGGQARRLDVATALVGRPELIFLDEPTTGFDPAARRRAWHTIRRLRDVGTTVVLTTHYMEEAQHLADRVAVMRAGEIVGIGTPAELADQLSLRSCLTFRLPSGIGVDDLPLLPDTTIADIEVDGEYVQLACGDPTSALASLCTWALANGHRLHEMELRAPSLEDSYLTLTGHDLAASSS